MKKNIFSIFLACVLTSFVHAAGVDIYLDPLNGNDKWSGMTEVASDFKTTGPIKSLERAQDIVAELTKNINQQKVPRPDYIKVHVNGTVKIKTPFIIDGDDAGIDNDLPVQWLGGTIDAGEELEIYKDGNLYYANWPMEGKPPITVTTEENQATYKAKVAREPDGNQFFTIKSANLTTETPTSFVVNAAEIPLVRKGEVNVLHYWNHQKRKPSSVTDAGVVTVSPAFIRRLSETFDNKNYARYYVSGHKDFIDEVGEWAYDAATNKIWIKLDDNTTINKITVGYQKEILSVWNTKHVVFDGITFANGGWNEPTKYLDGQSAVLPATRMSENFIGWNTRNILFKECSFVNMNGYGLDLNSNVKNVDFLSCEFVSVGNGGLKIGEVYSNQEPYVSRDIKVVDCKVKNFGLVYHGGAGILITKARNVLVDNNTIENGQHNGISAGWQWFYGPSLTSQILITNNTISNLGPYLSDLGGIYTLGEQPDTIISGNTISNVSRAPFGYGARGVYLDQASSYIKIFDNKVIGNTFDHAYFQHWKGKGVEHDPLTNLSSSLPYIQKPEQ